MTKTTSISMKTKRLTTSGVMLGLATAIALVCEFIPFLNLSFGGTITIASMVPVMILSYMYGVKWGLVTSFTYSIIQIMMSLITGSTVRALFTPSDDSFMGIGIAVTVILIDYMIAYSVLGTAGLFRNKFKNKTTSIVVGFIVALSLCYLAHIVSGFIFYGAWADWFFALIGWNWVLDTFTGSLLKVLYSIAYNGCYMIPEIIISSFAGVALSRIPQVRKMDPA